MLDARGRLAPVASQAVLWLTIVIFQFGSLVGVTAGQSPGDSRAGVIQGIVTIGPACPIESSEPCRVDPKIFASRRVLVYKKGAAVPFVKLKVNANGRYRGKLEPGDYVVDISREGIDRSDEVPREVHLGPGQVVTIDITVDTGVR